MIGILLIFIVFLIFVFLYFFIYFGIQRYFKLKNCEIFTYDESYENLPNASSKRTIISLTTTPERIFHLKPTIASLLDQNVKVDEICLFIPYISRKGVEYEIPYWLTSTKSIVIYRVEKDEGPSTKLLFALRKENKNNNKETRIIVVDDDRIYNKNTIKTLVDIYEKNLLQGDITAVTHLGLCLSHHGKFPSKWSRLCSAFSNCKLVDLIQGVSGFLVTPSMFPVEAYELKNCPEEAITVDDVWFSCWLQLNNIKIISSGKFINYIPLPVLGNISKTPSLISNENKGCIRDEKVVEWFMREKGFLPLCNRYKTY